MSHLEVANERMEGPVPLTSAGTASELFPPVCLKSHWDPTLINRWTLPDQKVDLPMDFRPYVKICKDYVTSAPAIEAPMPPSNMVFPTGGEFYPPGRYSAAIDVESKLFYLDRTLDRWCQKKEYVPPRNSDMYVPNVMVTRSQRPTSDFVQELAMPQAVLREGAYNCRTENDIRLWERSPRLFSNPTKQDRWGSRTYSDLPGGKLIFPHGGAPVPPPTAQAVAGSQLVGSMEQFGPIHIPGGYVPTPPPEGSVKPLGDARPDRSHPNRVAGISTAGGYAPV